MRRFATAFLCAALLGVVHCGDDDSAAKAAAANACPSVAEGCTDACPGVVGRQVYDKLCSDDKTPLWCRPVNAVQTNMMGCVARGKSIYITPTTSYYLDGNNLRRCTSQEEEAASVAQPTCR